MVPMRCSFNGTVPSYAPCLHFLTGPAYGFKAHPFAVAPNRLVVVTRTPARGCPLNRHRGFTIVELLVVVSIIAMLMGLLLPAVMGARAAARKVECANNMRQVGQGLLHRTMSKSGYFPGYREIHRFPEESRIAERLGTHLIPVSWAFTLLPDLGHSDILEADYGGYDNNYLPVFICPSDKPDSYQHTWLSYVVNCGIEDPPQKGQPAKFVPDSRFNGLFHDLVLDRSAFPHAAHLMRTNISHVRDGVQKTLMLAENVDAGLWASEHELDIGFVWLDADGAEVRGINVETRKGPFRKIGANFTKNTGQFARPSSYHTGGVNMAFCDGHIQFLREDIEYRVYAQLMTPHGRKSLVNVTNQVVAPKRYRDVISEGDFSN